MICDVDINPAESAPCPPSDCNSSTKVTNIDAGSLVENNDAVVCKLEKEENNDVEDECKFGLGECEEPEQTRRIFIGGLDHRTTDKSLKSYFQQFGEIVDVVVMKDPRTKRSRGFGFIAFSYSYMVDETQKRAPHTIDGRIVETKRAVAREEISRPETGTAVKKLLIGAIKDDTKNETEPEQTRKIFIGGIDHRTTDESLKEYFEQFGEIVDVVVMKDAKTGRSRGFGFVAFSNSYMVDETQKNRPHTIDGKTVETKRAVSRYDINIPETGNTVNKLFIGGIKDGTEEEELREVFSEFGEIVTISIPVDKETQKLRGFAFVEFGDYDAVDKACLRRDITIKNHKVEVKKALSKHEIVQNQRRGGGGFHSRGRGRGRGVSGGSLIRII